MSKKLQTQIDAIKKSILNKNVTNTSMATYGKLNEIGHSLYRYDQLSKAGLKDEAKTENTKANNLISNFNATEEGTVLKGGISNTRYVWVAEDGACDDCQAMDGTEYASPEDATIPLHPNCKCQIEEVYDEESDETNNEEVSEPCDCYEKIDEMIASAESYEAEIDNAKNEIESDNDNLDSKLAEIKAFAEEVERKKEELIELAEATNNKEKVADFVLLFNPINLSPLRFIKEELAALLQDGLTVYELFESNMDEMKAVKGYDKYYHAKANCEGTRLGMVEELYSGIFSLGKEVNDIHYKTTNKVMSFEEAWDDSMRDLRADWYGIQQAKMEIECGEAVKDVGDIFK